jgi:transcriptional regulator with XRE-family HTH domain
MQDFSAELRAFMEARGLNQSQVAKSAKVSQATVSRALTKRPQRCGRAITGLCIYIRNELDAPKFDERDRNQVVKAFDRIWDGTDVHAAAVARIIDALAGMRRPEDREEQGPD